MGKKILAVLSGLAVVLGITLVIAAPASASPSDCPVGIGCAWVDKNASGARLNLPISLYPADICHNLPSGWVNVITSTEVGYGSGYGIEWYTNDNCNLIPGYIFDQPHNTYQSEWLGKANDNFNSFKIERL